MKHRSRKFISLAAATILAGILATGAVAAVVSSSSTELLRIDNRSDADDQITTSHTFVDLVGASVQVTLSGGPRLIRARYTGESECAGAAGESWCAVRIVAVDTTTLVVTSLHPRSEKNFAFDSVGATDQWEAHAMERSRRLPPGTYDIKVQWRVVGAATFRLDDWHFTVETFR